MKTQFSLNGVVKSLVVVSALASSSVFAVVLPAVSSCSFGPGNLLCYTTASGSELYVASAHDDLYSYGVNAISTYINLGYTGLTDFSNGLGSGNILKLFTYNSATNGTFPDATLDTNAGSTFTGSWPTVDFSIGTLKTYLGTGTTPVFGFDFAEPQGGDAGLFINGKFEIKSSTGTVLETFAFDDIFNSAYDFNSLVFGAASQDILWREASGTCPASQGSLTVITVGPATAGGVMCTTNISNEAGGGGADFYAFAPKFNVYDYADNATLFVTIRMTGLDGAGDELFLASGVTSPSNVPEPGTIALVGLGLLGLGLKRNRKSSQV